MSRARVLLLAPHHPPEVGAAAARLGGFAAGLRALGHAVHVVAPRPSYMLPAGSSADAEAQWVEVAPRGRGVLAQAAHQVRLRRALRAGALRALESFRPDVVLVSTPPPLPALAGLGLRRGAPLPVVLDVRDVWPDVLVESDEMSHRSPAAVVLRWIARRLVRGARAVTTVTEGKRVKLAARSSVPVVLVGNGVDAAWVQGGPPYAGGAAAPFEVLHAGNVGRAQDVELLVRALHELARGEPAVRGTIVGEGERIDGVRAEARRLDAPVDFLAVESREALKRRLAGCGCAFVSLRTARLADSVPAKLLDCMARGVPVVLAAAGEAADLLRASGGGLVVPPGDSAALARALRDVASRSPAARREMGEAGRRHVLAHHRREDAVRILSAVLDEAAACPA